MDNAITNEMISTAATVISRMYSSEDPGELQAGRAVVQALYPLIAGQRTVRVAVRTVYNKDLVYPDNDTARTFAALTGTKTFSRADIENIRRLGYTITMTASGDLPDGYGTAQIEA